MRAIVSVLAIAYAFVASALTELPWFTEDRATVTTALGASGKSSQGTWSVEGAQLSDVLSVVESTVKIEAEDAPLLYTPNEVKIDGSSTYTIKMTFEGSVNVTPGDAVDEGIQAAIAVVKDGDKFYYAVADDGKWSKTETEATELATEKTVTITIGETISYDVDGTIIEGEAAIAEGIIAKPSAAAFQGIGSFTTFSAVFMSEGVAQIDDKIYTTFDDAYAAATNGATIKLLADVTWDPTFGTVFKNVTINANKKKFDISAATATYNAKGYKCKMNGTTLEIGLPFGGAGTETSPWTIGDYETLELFRKGVLAKSYGVTVGEYFQQTATISFSGKDAWVGIGVFGNDSGTDDPAASSMDGAFRGVYDGAGNEITDLVFATGKYHGFFNQICEGEVKNLTITLGAGDNNSGFVSTASQHGAGVLVGGARNAKLIGLTAKGALSCDHNAAGILAHATGTVILESCTNEVAVSGTYSKVGGLVTMSYNGSITFTNCVNKGSVAAHGEAAGYDGVGGLIGHVHSSCGTLKVIDCANEGAVTTECTNNSGSAYAGQQDVPRVGSYVGLINGTNAKTIIAGGVNTAADTQLVVGCVAMPAYGAAFALATVENGIAAFPVAGVEVGGEYKVMAYGVAGNYAIAGVGEVTFDRSLYQAFNPTIDAGSVGCLARVDATQTTDDLLVIATCFPFAAGDGTSAAPYEIPDYETLVLFKNGVNAETYGKSGECFKLTDNIDFADVDGQGTDADPWPGVGFCGKWSDSDKAYFADYEAKMQKASFIGTFDGDGHTIKNVVFSKAPVTPWDPSDLDHGYCGFFNSAFHATIKNLSISLGGFNGWLDDAQSGTFGGGVFVGSARDSVLQNLETLTTGTADTFKTTHATGGIVAMCYSNTVVKACTNNLKIVSSTSKFGGIACICEVSTGDYKINFQDCVNNGDLEATAKANNGVAGLVGYNTVYIKVSNFVNNGTITVANKDGMKIGNIAGHLSGASCVEASGVNKGLADYLSAPVYALANLKFATVDNGVATYVADADIAVGGNYLLTAPLASYEFTFDKAGTITVDKSLYAGFTATAKKGGFGVKTPEVKVEGNIITMTATKMPPMILYFN